MSGLDVFDRTVQKSLSWVDEIAGNLGTDRRGAYRALRAVLHVLRDRLTPVEATELAAQMPMLIRGMYYDGYSIKRRRARIKHRDELLARVADALGPTATEDDAADAVHAVFALLEAHVSAGEIEDVRHELPHTLRTLWAIESRP
jgi:uncharacterized protein (DUF2267 family)